MPDLADLFPGYESKWINTSSGRIFARVGGNGDKAAILWEGEPVGGTLQRPGACGAHGNDPAAGR